MCPITEEGTRGSVRFEWLRTYWPACADILLIRQKQEYSFNFDIGQ